MIYLDMASGEKERDRVYQLVFHVIIPLFLGGLLYYYICPDVLFVKKLDLLLGIDHYYLDLRFIGFDLVRNYVFDYIWAYSFTASLLIFVFHDFDVKRIKVFFFVVILFEIVVEAIQVVPEIPGTFDPFDIVVEIISSICVVLILKWREIINAKS
ncbi:MAG: hypothetical protein K6G24_09840 [Lachnospiraceae bacterium]|nr:hypothetical protein [Lachnospiraceae bacterium]